MMGFGFWKGHLVCSFVPYFGFLFGWFLKFIYHSVLSSLADVNKTQTLGLLVESHYWN